MRYAVATTDNKNACRRRAGDRVKGAKEGAAPGRSSNRRCILLSRLQRTRDNDQAGSVLSGFPGPQRRGIEGPGIVIDASTDAEAIAKARASLDFAIAAGACLWASDTTIHQFLSDDANHNVKAQVSR